MNFAEFQLQASGDPRLAAYAASRLPAWVWSSDGTRILWANPAGASVFGAADGAALATRIFGPADRYRRQIAQLAGRVPTGDAIRLERLQGFGAAPGMLATCGYQRIDFHDGSHGILIAAGAPPVVRERTVAAMPPETKPSEPPAAAHAEPLLAPQPAADVEQPSPSQPAETPAEFALFDAFAEPSAAPVVEPTLANEPPEPGLESVLQLDLPHVEAAPREPHAETASEATPAIEADAREPSPYIKAVADEPLDAEAIAAPVPAPSPLDESLPAPQRLPLRFTWQVDQDDRFTLGTDEFIRLIGPHTAAGFGRPWREIAETFGLDPDGHVAEALATRATWTGITLNWPVDGGGRLPVELSGLPVFDAARNFYGYRGFGVCRDIDGLTRLAAERDHPSFEGAAPPPPWSADFVQAGPAADAPANDRHGEDSSDPTGAASASFAELPGPIASETSLQTDLETPVEPPKDTQTDTQTDALTETPVETPKNVLPFRPPGDARPPSLTPVENSAFNELARQLSARLDTETGAETPDVTGFDETVVEKPALVTMYEGPSEAPATATPEWLAPSEPPARGETRRDKPLLDLLPVGILIYRLDRLLYANSAFLTQMGYPSLHALEDAGGLDALYVEPGVSNASSTSDTGTPVTISASQPSDEHAPPAAADARLYTISWDGDSALALIFSGTRHEGEAVAAAIAHASPAQPGALAEALVVEALVAEPPVAEQPSPGGHADAEELGAILDTTAEGIVMFDAEGNINSANRSAEALFGHDGDALARCNLADLFAPASRHAVFDYLAGIKSSGVASLLDHGREVLGRESKGGIIPLSMTMGRTRPDGPNFFAVFRDLSQARQTENELREARRLAERAGTAKADVLARISHEVRTPLNAIIGFAEVMIGERFGALGNERYAEYMKDIRASGERVIAIINDLLDLSRIETGKLDLAFTTQNLNELVESCVAVMQPQANRERIIIRTSLAHTLPPVLADARALRQIALNLIGNSIHLANAGGQVIVSTALSDFGEVMLRVRDTGHGLNDNEVAAALEPFRTQAPSDQTSDSGVSLSLTKALVEANRAKFRIRTGGRSGTLIEVVFPHAVANV
ncbi:PAS domain-containing protein [Bradyrhizobium sp. KBS0727]|uniref:histidine kinase dimerization/phospho-acceptor domain-containing protein n=1 Tax=unclassified Bradyrhizobium TaxID=2631580 RepID=UPI00110D9530|nr:MULTISPECIES: histidine kinase dimerization/phospho-acceptor domain-containing protein [unclassified Bradyrhizobium]QDW40860.1 PAS domain-containing protein [Bradyrhizobium sp. KBS0725]QDW47466.1 PAS domain-containing protein [Bradyrhizobium sp. KBS0727]